MPRVPIPIPRVVLQTGEGGVEPVVPRVAIPTLKVDSSKEKKKSMKR